MPRLGALSGRAGDPKVQIIDKSVAVGSSDAGEEVFGLSEERREVHPPDGVFDHGLRDLRRVLAYGAEQGDHPEIRLGQPRGVRIFEDRLLHLAGLFGGELARGVGPDLLQELPAVGLDHRESSSDSLASTTSRAARPLLTQPFAVPSGTSGMYGRSSSNSRASLPCSLRRVLRQVFTVIL